ncbi:MAG TPA: hypothetical protein VF042_13725 [Gemmatimonadaceae bacterium]
MKKREALLLAAYIVMIAIVATYHEMWRDEVRAFSVAITSPSWSAMMSNLHGEGHPALWYVILRIGYALTHSNLVLPVTAALIGVATAALILWYAPFPLLVRALAVFGAFIGYELTINARNYGIGVLLIVVACIAYRYRANRPWLLGISLALLANTSVHAALAASLILAYWIFDTLRSRDGRSPWTIAAIGSVALVIAGIIVAIVTSRPNPEMAFAMGLQNLDAMKILRTIFTDPGKALLGFNDANVAATGEYPWRMTPISPQLGSRILVDAALLWLAFHMRRSVRALAFIVVAIIAFEIVFRNVYTAGLRHEGLLLFLIFGFCWMDAESRPTELRAVTSRRLATGLLPLFVMQSLALPILVHRAVRYPQSVSKNYGSFLRSHREFNNAILAAEPDFLMEAMPYYVGNRIYMPRQREFSRVVLFDKGARRQKILTLSELAARMDSVACAERAPVLLAMGKPAASTREGEAPVPYDALFRWTKDEMRALRERYPVVANFPRATTDEIYRVYLVNPECSGKS